MDPKPPQACRLQTQERQEPYTIKPSPSFSVSFSDEATFMLTNFSACVWLLFKGYTSSQHVLHHLSCVCLQSQERQESYGIKPSPSFSVSFSDEATTQPRTGSLPVQQSAVAKGSDPLSQVHPASDRYHQPLNPSHWATGWLHISESQTATRLLHMCLHMCPPGLGQLNLTVALHLNMPCVSCHDTYRSGFLMTSGECFHRTACSKLMSSFIHHLSIH